MKEMTAALPLLINQRVVRILMSMEIVVAETSEISIVDNFCLQCYYVHSLLSQYVNLANSTKLQARARADHCLGRENSLMAPWEKIAYHILYRGDLSPTSIQSCHC